MMIINDDFPSIEGNPKAIARFNEICKTPFRGYKDNKKTTLKEIDKQNKQIAAYFSKNGKLKISIAFILDCLRFRNPFIRYNYYLKRNLDLDKMNERRKQRSKIFWDDVGKAFLIRLENEC